MIASIFMECTTVNEVDRLTTEFNHMLPVLRDHIQRIEDINSDLYAIGKLHPDGYIIINMENKK